MDMTTERQRIVAGNLAGLAIAFLLFIAPMHNLVKFALILPTIIWTGRNAKREQITQAEVNHVLYQGATTVLEEVKSAIDRGYAAWQPEPLYLPKPVMKGTRILTETLKPYLPEYQAELNWLERYRTVISEKFIVITGKSREGKTMAAHQMMHEFCQVHDDALILIHDSDYGVSDNPSYIPDWCGLPAFSNAPTVDDADMRSQVVTGEDEFASLVNTGFTLFEGRSGANADTFPILLIFDDVTTRIGELGDEKESIQGKLRKIATRGKKRNIHVWILTHSVTTKESGFDTSLFDNSCLIAGVQATKNKYVKERFDIDPDVWNLGCEKRRANERAFITTHPDIPSGYLPAPKFNSTKELHLNWGEPLNPEEKQLIERQRTFNQRLQLPEVQNAIAAHRQGKTNWRNCFRAVWGKAQAGKFFLEAKILKDYLASPVESFPEEEMNEPADNEVISESGNEIS